MIVPIKLNMKKMILICNVHAMCNQCVINVYLRLYQAFKANTFQIKKIYWIIMVMPDKLNVKNKIVICIQCVFNMYFRSYQTLEASTSHIST